MKPWRSDKCGRRALIAAERSAGRVTTRFIAVSRANREAGARLGPETSIDKVLVASAEQAVFDLVEEALSADIVLDDGPVSGRWRSEYLYSRAATIYGGSAEIQRNIIARRLLDLGSDR